MWLWGIRWCLLKSRKSSCNHISLHFSATIISRAAIYQLLNSCRQKVNFHIKIFHVAPVKITTRFFIKFWAARRQRIFLPAPPKKKIILLYFLIQFSSFPLRIYQITTNKKKKADILINIFPLTSVYVASACIYSAYMRNNPANDDSTFLVFMTEQKINK